MFSEVWCSARTPYLMYDVYRNDSLHGVCFPIVLWLNYTELIMKDYILAVPVNKSRVIALKKEETRQFFLSKMAVQYSLLTDVY